MKAQRGGAEVELCLPLLSSLDGVGGWRRDPAALPHGVQEAGRALISNNVYNVHELHIYL